MAFFVHPDDEVMIECLDKSNKYQPIGSLEYLNQRFSATYWPQININQSTVWTDIK